MNISIQSIVAKVEAEVQKLKKATEQGNQQAIREHAAVIKAYSELLQDNEESRQPTPVGEGKSISKVVPSPVVDVDEKESLFDF
ncbi:DUF5327 family protein [Alkalihalobacillus sp. LMS39]|uniref:DUF5327 family protein n=1 Tax=Alkalihalobacillus sp. LMS39 TaxID=2924032 RepID=UPI001FB379AE|nr:DUF5327 family protein [Alkalihalobacillus sp. LMS39]UOE94002.1 YwdI family protein [Alkalihalobacillus sp. LMS39]